MVILIRASDTWNSVGALNTCDFMMRALDMWICVCTAHM